MARGSGRNGVLSAVSEQGFARAMLPAAGGDFLLSCTITIRRGSAAGLICRAHESGEGGYCLRLEPATGSVSLRRYPGRQHVHSIFILVYPNKSIIDDMISDILDE